MQGSMTGYVYKPVVRSKQPGNKKWSRPTANISHRGGRKVWEWPPASAVFRRDGPRGGGRLVPSIAWGMRVRHPAGIISRVMSIFGAADRSGPPPRRTFQQVTAELGISQEPGSPPRAPGSVLCKLGLRSALPRQRWGRCQYQRQRSEGYAKSAKGTPLTSHRRIGRVLASVGGGSC